MTTPNLLIDFKSPEYRDDPFGLFARLRPRAAVVPTRGSFVRGARFIMRYADVQAVLKDPRFANDSRNAGLLHPMGAWWMPRLFKSMQDNLANRDGSDHRRLRNLVQVAFTPKRVRQMEDVAQTTVERILDEAEHRGELELIADFALPLPLLIISEMMGVPEADRADFQRWTSALAASFAKGITGVLWAIPSGNRLMRLIERIIEERRVEPRNDLITDLVAAESEGARLEAGEVLSMVFLLLLAGYETTVHLIASGTLALVQNPEQRQLLRERPELRDGAIEELARYTSPALYTTPRYAGEDLEIGGEAVPRGTALFPGVASANHDGEEFDEPERLLLERSPNRHLTFGQGIHYCLGAPLARLEVGIAIEALVRRFPKMRLAVPPERLQWMLSLTLRGLVTLPLRLK